jgi:hypothetical protein
MHALNDDNFLNCDQIIILLKQDLWWLLGNLCCEVYLVYNIHRASELIASKHFGKLTYSYHNILGRLHYLHCLMLKKKKKKKEEIKGQGPQLLSDRTKVSFCSVLARI